MSGPLLSVARYRVRTTLRRQWIGGLTVVLLIGLVSGMGLGSLSAARRTQSSFSIFLASTNPSDLGVAAFTPRPRNFTAVIRRLDHVRTVEGFVNFPAVLVKPHGVVPLLPSVTLVGSLGAEFFSQDRFTVTDGRLADPRRANEVMVSQTAAKILRLRVGKALTLGFPTTALNTVGRPTRVTVVGIGLLNSQIVQDDIQRLPTYMIVTPALTNSLGSKYRGIPWYEIQVAGGSRNVPAVEHEIERHVRAYLVFNASSVFAAQAELAIKPVATALWVFGVIAVLAGLLLALQAMARLLHTRDPDLDVMRALGATPAMTVSDGLIVALSAVVVGSMLAASVAVALSPLSPVGPARAVYPTRGVAFDWTVVGLGILVLIVILGAFTVSIAYRGSPHRALRRAEPLRRGSAVVRTVAGSGLPVPAAVGVRFALEPGDRRGSMSVRSALFGAVLAMAMVTATLTFGSGLSTLISHPALYGWNWNMALDSSNGYGPIPPKAQASLSHDPLVASWTGVTFFVLQLNGVATPVLFAAAPAPFSPPILLGHALTASNQIVLGPATLASLHERLGGRVRVGYGFGPRSLSKTLTIVGTATLPAIGISQGQHTSMGTGAMLPNGAFPSLSVQGYPRACNGPNMALVRWRAGVTSSSGAASLRRIAGVANAEFASATDNCGLFVSVLGVQKPAQIRDYGSVGISPNVLASGLAGGAVVALAFTLVASVRRRRRELALLKALGFTQRQLASAVAWQASVVGLAGVVVGAPLGVALGRWLWTLFAREVYAVPQTSVPVGEIMWVCLGAMVLVNIVAALPGHSAARTRTALVLRAE